MSNSEQTTNTTVEENPENIKQVTIENTGKKTLANTIANKNRNKPSGKPSANINESSAPIPAKSENTAVEDEDEGEETTTAAPADIGADIDAAIDAKADENKNVDDNTDVEDELDAALEDKEDVTTANATESAEKPNLTVKNANKNKKQLDNLNQVCINMFNHYIAMKLYHFQTANYSAHKTSDSYIEHFLSLMDRFLEVAQGIYGKVNLKKYDIKGSSHDDTNIFNHINGFIKYLSTGMDEVLDNRTDLINIRDELLSEANQLKYLLTFT